MSQTPTMEELVLGSRTCFKRCVAYLLVVTIFLLHFQLFSPYPNQIHGELQNSIYGITIVMIRLLADSKKIFKSYAQFPKKVRNTFKNKNIDAAFNREEQILLNFTIRHFEIQERKEY